MNILFVHNNFPAQFRHLAAALAADPRHRVAAIGSPTARSIPGVTLLRYAAAAGSTAATHSFARRFDVECRRAEQVLYLVTTLERRGFEPDVIVAHSGWGEALPLRSAYPRARLIVYCEFFYRPENQDVNFDPEFPRLSLDGTVGLSIKNAASLLALVEADLGLSPTRWQRDTFPADLRDKITVLHEGVDTDVLRPRADARIELPGGLVLGRGDEVVTFVARDLEPLRGYHGFMRALPQILAARPRAHAVIVGSDGVSYGAAPPAGTTWKQHYLDEVKDRLDLRRVHFVGRLPHPAFIAALQVSSAHVYLSYPFVLSWSLIEALSCGCAVVASDVGPVREVIDGRNGLLVPSFDHRAVAAAVIDVLCFPGRYEAMRARARAGAVQAFDLRRVCLPAALALVTGGPSPSP